MLGMSATREPVKLKGNTTYPLATIESYKTNLSPPVVFQICFESRDEALKSYSLEFYRTEEQALEWGVSRQTLRGFRCPSSSFQRWRRGIYIHESLDIICPVGRNSVYGYVATGLALRGAFGKTFAISIGCFEKWCKRPEPHQAGYIWDFRKIEEIILYDENLLRRRKLPFDFDFVDMAVPRDRMKHYMAELEKLSSTEEYRCKKDNVPFTRPRVRPMRPVYARERRKD